MLYLEDKKQFETGTIYRFNETGPNDETLENYGVVSHDTYSGNSGQFEVCLINPSLNQRVTFNAEDIEWIHPEVGTYVYKGEQRHIRIISDAKDLPPNILYLLGRLVVVWTDSDTRIYDEAARKLKLG